MKTQIVKAINDGTYLVIHDNSDTMNPYRIYKVWHEAKDGCIRTKRQKLINKYADLTSCMIQITNLISKEEYGFEIIKYPGN